MKIQNYKSEKTEKGLKYSAEVIWEDSAVAGADLTITSPGFKGNSFPVAFFLINMLPSALWQGESRVQIEGDVDLVLLENLQVALSNLSAWFCNNRKIPSIEVLGRVITPKPEGEGCGMTISGGVDSLCLLINNRNTFPRGHPFSVTHAFFIDGMDINFSGKGEDQSNFFWKSFEMMRGFCQKKGVELLPVHTNLRDPRLALCSWADMHHGMALAGILQSFSHLISNGFIAGGYPAKDIIPHGTHPMVDPYCGSYAVRIHHALSHVGRLQRVRIVSEDKDALSCLRVCWLNIKNDGPLNCSRCHKCVLTMLELLVSGRLALCPTFAFDDVTPEMAEKALRNNTPSSLPFLRELVKPLRDIGRIDLSTVVSKKIKAIENLGKARRGIIMKIVRRIRDILAWL